jgi:hypothetical protein
LKFFDRGTSKKTNINFLERKKLLKKKHTLLTLVQKISGNLIGRRVKNLKGIKYLS